MLEASTLLDSEEQLLHSDGEGTQRDKGGDDSGEDALGEKQRAEEIVDSEDETIKRGKIPSQLDAMERGNSKNE